MGIYHEDKADANRAFQRLRDVEEANGASFEFDFFGDPDTWPHKLDSVGCEYSLIEEGDSEPLYCWNVQSTRTLSCYRIHPTTTPRVEAGRVPFKERIMTKTDDPPTPD